MPTQRPNKKLLSVYLDKDKYNKLKDKSPSNISDTINRLVDLFLEDKIEVPEGKSNNELEQLIEEIVERKLSEGIITIHYTQSLADELNMDVRSVRRMFDNKNVGDNVTAINSVGQKLKIKLLERNGKHGNRYETRIIG